MTAGGAAVAAAGGTAGAASLLLPVPGAASFQGCAALLLTWHWLFVNYPWGVGEADTFPRSLGAS